MRDLIHGQIVALAYEHNLATGEQTLLATVRPAVSHVRARNPIVHAYSVAVPCHNDAASALIFARPRALWIEGDGAEGRIVAISDPMAS